MRKKWHKLDNIGKYYSSIAYKSTQKVFRYSVTLKRYVKKEVLQMALSETLKQYRNFNVHLKQGFFWYYTLEDKEIGKVKKEDLPICYKLYDNSNDFLYRVTYYKKRINFELSHIISDGLGSLEFFKLLINNYINIRYDLKIKDLYKKIPSKELEEDSFIKNYKKSTKSTRKIKNIYIYKGKKYKKGLQFLEAHLPLKDVIDLSHEYGTSLTVFLTALLIYSFKTCLSNFEYRKNIKIDIPVNLRNYCPSNSSKNYFALVSVAYRFNKNDTIRNVINSVEEQLKKVLSKEEVLIRVNKMVAFEKNIFCRISPLFLKNIFLKITNQFSISMSSTCLSNVGKVEFHEKVNKYIENVNVITNTPNFQLAICSFEDDLSINISNVFMNNKVIRNFLRFFSNNNIDVLVNANEVKR